MTDLERNKENAIAFYKMAFEGNPILASSKYIGGQYKQHNPQVGDGITPFIEYFEQKDKNYPRKTIEFIRAIAEGDLVVLHTHQVLDQGKEYVTMDLFRFDENGKIIEHWDVIQKIPEKSANNNTMY